MSEAMPEPDKRTQTIRVWVDEQLAIVSPKLPVGVNYVGQNFFFTRDDGERVLVRVGAVVEE